MCSENLSKQINSLISSDKKDPILMKILNEINSDARIRQNLIRELQDLSKRHTIVYISSLAPFPIAMINDWDAITIENILKGYKRIKKLDLIIHSSGGLAESAERIVNSINTSFELCNI